MRRIITLLFTLLLILSVFDSKAQDVHFSQFFNAPMLLNPALTGLMGTDMRLASNYRTQWGSVATPYRTMAASVDFSPGRYIFNTDDIAGVGFYVMNDKAGITELTNTQIQMSFAYSKSLNGRGNNYLSIGGQLGYGQQRLNQQNLTFDNQIEGNTLNTSLGSGEQLSFDNFSFWDVSAGIAWSYTPEKSTSIYAGLSAAHLNEPQVSFFDDFRELLYRKYSAYAGGEFRVNYVLSVLPRAYYLKQGPSTELTAGALVKFNMGEQGRYRDLSSLYFGGLYRVGDAAIFIVKYDFNKNIAVSFNYDLNISALKQVSRGYGAMEIALLYQTSLSSKGGRGRPVQCPHF